MKAEEFETATKVIGKEYSRESEGRQESENLGREWMWVRRQLENQERN